MGAGGGEALEFFTGFQYALSTLILLAALTLIFVLYSLPLRFPAGTPYVSQMNTYNNSSFSVPYSQTQSQANLCIYKSYQAAWLNETAIPKFLS